MKLRALDHAALLVKDVERSRQFYGQLLGLEEVPRPSNFDFPGAWFAVGTQTVHIIGENEVGRAQQLHSGNYRPDELAIGHIAHTAFEVDDLDETVQYLHAHDIQIVGGPRPRGDGVMQLYICDPDSYVVELFAWKK
jgi:catechol 2,3-dioxygenase-like lactoylglutathione lyase family enzyme